MRDLTAWVELQHWRAPVLHWLDGPSVRGSTAEAAARAGRARVATAAKRILSEGLVVRLFRL